MVHTGSYEPLGPSRAGNGDSGEAVERYRLSKWRLQNQAIKLLPGWKSLEKCHRTRRERVVTVWRSAERQTAALRGLCTCQSVWACPVCSAKISARRASELTAGIATARSQGLTPLLVTFTASHGRDDRLADLLGQHKAASQRFWRQGNVKQCLAAAECAGRVAAFECTWGQGTGFHPHQHVLLFVERWEEHQGYLREVLERAWLTACARVGLSAREGVAFDMRGGDAAGAYVAKLGLEVALAVCKRGRASDRFGIWELLASDWPPAHRAFVEFAAAMKGKTHVRWSRGLRQRFGLADVTDEEIMAEQADQDEAVFMRLPGRPWAAIVQAEARGELLNLAAAGKLPEARELLASLGVDLSDRRNCVDA